MEMYKPQTERAWKGRPGGGEGRVLWDVHIEDHAEMRALDPGVSFIQAKLSVCLSSES